MRKQGLGAVVLAVALSLVAEAQDAKTILDQVAQTMGVSDIQSVRYAGSGFYFAFGQNYAPDQPWPRFRMERYDRFVDYEHLESREEIVRTQAESPPRGGGNQPLIGIQQQIVSVSQDYAWNETAVLPSLPDRNSGIDPLPAAPSPSATPNPAAVAERRRQIWMTPHGFVKAALAREVTLSYQTQRRRRLTILSFTMDDGTPVSGMVNDNNQIERVDARIPNPVLGDMLVEIAYLNYKDFGGVQFPAHILQSQGGFETLEVVITDVAANPPDRLAVPPQARITKIDPPRVEVQPVAEGLWFLTGGSHNSVAVEFRDYVAVIEAPIDEARSLAVIAEIHRLAPNKQIRYLINTHHHFDHSGGLRAYVTEGATIITHGSNRRFYDLVFEAARQLNPDRMSRAGERAHVEPVDDHYLLRNGSRVMEIHLVEGNLHNAGLLMVYLPRERLLVEADAFTPGPPNSSPPAQANPFTVNLYENVQRLKLDVAQVAPIHGRLVPWSELLKAIGKQNQPQPDGMLHAGL